MADRYLIEGSAEDGYLLEDGSGVLILEESQVQDEFPPWPRPQPQLIQPIMAH